MNAIPPPLPPLPPTFIKFQYKALLWSTPPGTLKITHYNVSHNNGLCTSSQYRCVNGCLETISFRQAHPTQCAWIPAQVNMTTYLNTATWGNHSGWMLSPASPCFASPLVLQVTKTGRGLEPDLLSPVNCPRSWQAIWVEDKLPSLLKHLLVVYQPFKSSSYKVRFSTRTNLMPTTYLQTFSLAAKSCSLVMPLFLIKLLCSLWQAFMSLLDCNYYFSEQSMWDIWFAGHLKFGGKKIVRRSSNEASGTLPSLVLRLSCSKTRPWQSLPRGKAWYLFSHEWRQAHVRKRYQALPGLAMFTFQIAAHLSHCNTRGYVHV